MNAYKVIWQTFELTGGMWAGRIGHDNYGIVNKEKHFTTKEAALSFIADKDKAIKELNLGMVVKYPILVEVELE